MSPIAGMPVFFSFFKTWSGLVQVPSIESSRTTTNSSS
jgi:hypothetical protein